MMSTVFQEKVGAIAQFLGERVVMSDNKGAMSGLLVRLEYRADGELTNILAVLDYGYAMPITIGIQIRKETNR
jgi:hypothetical protein